MGLAHFAGARSASLGGPMMQKRLLAVLLLALACASTVPGQETIVSASVVGVHDGDSITVLLPFQTRPWISLVEPSPSTIVVFSLSIVTRLARPRSSNVMFSSLIPRSSVKQRYIGQADENTQASYRAARTAAKQERRGLWRDTQTPVPPWEFRHAAH
jgi:endonuclease YncB( thermonuclease family)